MLLGVKRELNNATIAARDPSGDQKDKTQNCGLQLAPLAITWKLLKLAALAARHPHANPNKQKQECSSQLVPLAINS